MLAPLASRARDGTVAPRDEEGAVGRVCGRPARVRLPRRPGRSRRDLHRHRGREHRAAARLGARHRPPRLPRAVLRTERVPHHLPGVGLHRDDRVPQLRHPRLVPRQRARVPRHLGARAWPGPAEHPRWRRHAGLARDRLARSEPPRCTARRVHRAGSGGLVPVHGEGADDAGHLPARHPPARRGQAVAR